jgi:hypothetical protein
MYIQSNKGETTMTKKRIIVIGVAFIAVIACAVTAIMFSQKSSVKGNADEDYYGNILPALPDGKYYAYGDTSRPYYELKGNTIQLHGISYDTFKKTWTLDGENAANLSDDYWQNCKTAYEKAISPKNYVLVKDNFTGKFIALDHKPADSNFDGAYLTVTDDGVILGFNPITFEENDAQASQGGVEAVPYVLVQNPALRQAQTFPDEYDILTPAAPTGHTIKKVAKPNDSFKFEGETETSTEPTLGETN